MQESLTQRFPRIDIFSARRIVCTEFSFARRRRVGYKVISPETVIIDAGASIGEGATIYPNNCIGAGSVVTKSFPDDVVVAGNPARVIRRLDF